MDDDDSVNDTCRYGMLRRVKPSEIDPCSSSGPAVDVMCLLDGSSRNRLNPLQRP